MSNISILIEKFNKVKQTASIEDIENYSLLLHDEFLDDFLVENKNFYQQYRKIEKVFENLSSSKKTRIENGKIIIDQKTHSILNTNEIFENLFPGFILNDSIILFLSNRESNFMLNWIICFSSK